MPKKNRECDGKIRHPDETAAIRAARHLEKSRGMLARAFSVYRCGTCDHWHIGHRLIRRKPRQRR